MPDGRAATFSSRRTGVVGLIVPTISNSIYAEFTEAIQSTLQDAGLSLLIANANYSARYRTRHHPQVDREPRRGRDPHRL